MDRDDARVTAMVPRKGFRAARVEWERNPLRNADAERGRPVTVADMAQRALPLHAKCRGRGVVGTRACACAQKRFMRAHPEVIVAYDDDGLLKCWWPAKTEAG